ncbi:MAG: hypothetical protein ACAH08_09070 [Methylophilus sp.]|uniref:hypothetical protein n=1 Tax=Methylophilus sp. TaxID=29541 RepID=UPI002D16C32A|nr:hypothetical protein [Methylophilus sp.]HSH86119.1 hypothetical protein [Methylophilus sp.]
MAFSSIQTNVAAMINKAYSTDTSTAANSTASTNAAGNAKASTNTKKDAPLPDSAKDNPAGASAEVKLGQTGNTTEIYTAQGLLQQMRQIQLSNAMLLFGNDEENAADSTGLMGMFGSESDTEGESDWTESISQQPDKAAIMVEKAKNNSIKTMLGG